MNSGSRYFRRIVNEAKKISPHIRFKRIKHGFYRIYFRNAYIGECSKDMNLIGHDIEEKNWNMEDFSYYRQMDDLADQTARLKNFREGYVETLDMLRTRTYMVKHNKEFYERARQGYSQLRIK